MLSRLELRCVIGIIRHGDRTPKQKMKMVVKHHDFLKLFEDLGGYKKGHLKIKKPRDLQVWTASILKIYMSIEST